MAFMTYLARQHHHHQYQKQEQQNESPLSSPQTPQPNINSKHINKRSVTLPTVIKKKREIGDYILCRTIGRGASGRVKLGIHKQTGEKVAIKMISRSHLQLSSSTSKSVQRELAVLQLLHHPHLIDLKQVLQDTQYVYFVMEYLQGGELFHVLAERGRLAESEVRHLFIQLTNALTWCHTHHISHRDLKPENILLDKEKKNLKIADFGMAAMQPLNALLKTSCGSPHYASPEIVRGKKYDGTATDVWSCGAILYAMMTGHLPFDDEHMGRLLAKIKTGRYRALPDYLSPDAKDLIRRMLVVDPTKRMTMPEILVHPWLTNKSFLGTDTRFLLQSQQQAAAQDAILVDPLSDPLLQLPMISRSTDLDGRIWETLKVLWREKTEDEIVSALSTQGCNLQKLTCKLLQERSIRLEQQQASSPIDNYNQSSVSLPQRRSSIMSATEELMSTSPHYRSSLQNFESYMLNSTQSSCSVDTMLCSSSRAPMELPPTPKSTTTFQLDSSVTVNEDPFICSSSIQQNIRSSLFSNNKTSHWMLHDAQTTTSSSAAIFRRGSKADAADLFVMTKPIESSLLSSIVHEEPVLTNNRSAWWLCSKDLDVAAAKKNEQEEVQKSKKKQKEMSWFDKTCQYLFNNNNHTKRRVSTSDKVITIECYSKHECETAGKLHQVLEESYQGKLTGRIYPHGKIVWSGTMNFNQDMISFICHMTKVDESKIRIHFIPRNSRQVPQEKQDYINELLDCLNKYELESDWVTKTNGWLNPISESSEVGVATS